MQRKHSDNKRRVTTDAVVALLFVCFLDLQSLAGLFLVDLACN